MDGFSEFEFDLATPLFEQIRACLDATPLAPLTIEKLDAGLDGPGVYILFHNREPVYIGKADSSVVTRLKKHRRTISGRKNIELTEVGFKTSVFASTWNPFLPESHLIEHYGTKKQWNSKGFGGNEPGIRRYETAYGTDHFFTRFPVNEQFVCHWLEAGEYEVSQLCSDLRRDLPFWFKTHPNSGNLAGEVTLPSSQPTAIDTIVRIATALGDDWRVAVLPSHILLEYKPTKNYPNQVIHFPPS